MVKSSRCLYYSSFDDFVNQGNDLIFGIMHENHHGTLLTTANEAWKSEIDIMKKVLSLIQDKVF